MWDGARVTDGKKLTFPHLLLPVLSFLRAAYADTRDDFPGETIWGNPAVPGPVKIFTCTDDTLNNQRFKSLFLDHAPSASATRPLPLSICGCEGDMN
jgi:hypothetical protein